MNLQEKLKIVMKRRMNREPTEREVLNSLQDPNLLHDVRVLEHKEIGEKLKQLRKAMATDQPNKLKSRVEEILDLLTEYFK